jgi:hypothetical protein
MVLAVQAGEAHPAVVLAVVRQGNAGIEGLGHGLIVAPNRRVSRGGHDLQSPDLP